ncbi:VanZ family protein [Emticicia sp. BO119]|uniref:VanZ family protein n=1 Tax=Emticicia sp. BO119 TaxID=2757768 RepID=UPI0015F01EEC|nr:VanZ family protein [Emticicia sp. BO119]MBA4851381.1 VanZ family protein [Emticicia sp. BO119]
MEIKEGVIAILSHKYSAFFISTMIFLLFSMPTRGITRGMASRGVKVTGHLDKVAHFVAFAAWAFCWQFVFKNYLQTFLIGIVYGMLLEVWQDNLPGKYRRTFSWYDGLADALGVVGGLLMYYIIQLFILIEAP